MYHDMREEMPIQCPHCKSIFMFPSRKVVHTKDQIELDLDKVREIHPEVNELGDEEGG